MPWWLKIVEYFACGLVGSAIAWLRYIYGAPWSRGGRPGGVRYVLPFGTVTLTALFMYAGVIDPRVRQPDLYPPDIQFFLGVAVVLAALLVWLLVEVRRYRAYREGGMGSNQLTKGGDAVDDEDDEDDLVS